ncbi:MAG: HlyD family secretion protein [Anaerolineae bacterium]|jgi:hypothetical protein
MRSLEADGFRPSLLGLFLAVVLLGAWLAWFFLARVTLYEVSQTARLVRPDMVVAEFPLSTLAHIQPGQPAQLRLDGFPWTQYGSVPATVEAITTRADEGRVQVDLTLDPHSAASIPLQPGLSGSVEIEVGCVSPAILALRAAGLRLPTTNIASQSQVSGEASQ